MNYKNLVKFLFLAIILVFIICPFFAKAKSLEIDYPTLSENTLTPQSTKALLPDYIKYLFSFALRMAGIVCFLSLAYGGFLHVSSVGNPTQIGEAKQQMLNSITGLIIILASYLLLNTVNPELVILKGPQINSSSMGIVVYDKEGCDKGIGEYNSLHLYSNTAFGDTALCRENDCDDDMRSQKDYWINHVKSIKFLNEPTEVKIKYALKPEPDKLTEFTFEKGGCQSVSFSELKKITFEYNLPGVYLYKDSGCKDEFLYSTVSTSGFPTKPVDWVNKVKCVRIVNTKESRFVAVLHEHSNYKGKCKEFIGKTEPDPKNPNSFDKFPLLSADNNKLANIKSSFALAQTGMGGNLNLPNINPNVFNPTPQTPPAGTSLPSSPQTQPQTVQELLQPKTETAPVSTPASGGTNVQAVSGFRDMADSLTVFEIPKQKRNDDSDQGVLLYDRANYNYSISQEIGIPAPSIFIQGSRPSEQLLNNVYYYFFNTGETDINAVAFGFFINLLNQMIPFGPKFEIPTEKLQKDLTFEITCNQSCNGCCVGFNKIKNSEDTITSLKVSPNYTAILWEHRNYGGMCEVFNNDVTNLNSYDMGKCFNLFGIGSSDCASSIKVFQKK